MRSKCNSARSVVVVVVVVLVLVRAEATRGTFPLRVAFSCGPTSSVCTGSTSRACVWEEARTTQRMCAVFGKHNVLTTALALQFGWEYWAMDGVPPTADAPDAVATRRVAAGVQESAPPWARHSARNELDEQACARAWT